VGAQAPATWAWGGPDNPRVDVLQLLYARSAADLIAHADSVRHRFPADGVREVVELPTTPLSPRDHLGFADGISQPEVTGLHGRGERGVALGEFLLGYPNAYGRPTGGPLLPAADDPGRVLPPARRADGPDRVDLGRNGSYLVVRTLAVDIVAFWQHIDRWAARTGLPAEQVAAEMVGRWPDGTSLTVSTDHPSATSRSTTTSGTTATGTPPASVARSRLTCGGPTRATRSTPVPARRPWCGSTTGTG
jgi:deferrochelatase/peroxidase EfeB